MTPLNINGTTYQVDVDPSTPLLWVLRDVLGLTGTKYGCGVEICGACMVWIDGSAEKACHLPIIEVVGKTITTIEGLSPDGASHPVQKAWVACQVPQCGYCQSGMIMRAAASFRGSATSSPTDTQINSTMGNLCVCGTYERIRKACKKIGKV